MTQQVFMVAGLGVNAQNYAPFEILRDSLANHANIFHFIDGASEKDGELIASTPSEQAEEIKKKADGIAPSKTLIISQSAGAIAAMQCVEDDPTGMTRLVAIAPPLPNPYKLLKHNAIQRRLRVNSSGLSVPSYSFRSSEKCEDGAPDQPLYIPVPPRYFDEMHEASPDFAQRIKKFDGLNLLSIVVPALDWNHNIHTVTAELKNTLAVNTPHSLYAKADEMKIACKSIYEYILKLTANEQEPESDGRLLGMVVSINSAEERSGLATRNEGEEYTLVA